MKMYDLKKKHTIYDYWLIKVCMIIKLFLFDYSISSYMQPNPKYLEGPFNGEPAATNPPPEEEGSFGDVGRIMQVSCFNEYIITWMLHQIFMYSDKIMLAAG